MDFFIDTAAKTFWDSTLSQALHNLLKPRLVYGTRETFRLHLGSYSGSAWVPKPLVAGDTWELGADTNYSHVDGLIIYTSAATIIDAEQGVLELSVDCLTTSFEAKITVESTSAHVELRQNVAGESRPRICLQDVVYCSPSVLEGAGVPTTSNPVYLTEAQILALLAAVTDKHNLGHVATIAEIPVTGVVGDYLICGETDTVWVYDTATAAFVDSDQKGQVASVNGAIGAVMITPASLGLGNVANTSDAAKPVSAAQQAALDLKADAADVTAALDLKADAATLADYATAADVTAAISEASSDYATAAQGGKADTALQPAALETYSTTSEMEAAIAAAQGASSFSELEGLPADNAALAAALELKANAADVATDAELAAGLEAKLDASALPVITGIVDNEKTLRARYSLDDNTLLLLHFDGDVADASNYARTATNAGTTSDTENKKFGAASRLFGGYVSYAPNTGLAFGESSYTIELFFKSTASFADVGALLSCGGLQGAAEYADGYDITVRQNSRIQWYDRQNGRSVVVGINAEGLSIGTGWHHFALVHNALTATTTMYLDGASIGSTADGTNIASVGTLKIGTCDDFSRSFLGNIDEVRISNVARYTGPFDPPVAAFAAMVYYDLGCVALDKGLNLSDLADASAARGNLGLGSAATTAASDYATATQGALAGTALQSAAIDPDATMTADSDAKTASQKAIKAALGLKADAVATATALALKADLSDGKVPLSQLPSFVGEVVEVANYAALPATGVASTIYLALDTGVTYRWGGTTYAALSSSVTLGETSATAYRGDRGAAAYAHVSNTANPHAVDKGDVGLGDADNTSDANKPISTAAAAALAAKAPLASPTFTGTVSGISKAMVGLSAVDNTADSAKPVSTAQQTALDGKVSTSRTVNGHALTADVAVSKSDVGLGNVDNVSDLSKPISTATQTALDGKVPTARTVAGHALSANVVVSKSDVGLGSVDNTSDAAKPISTATAAALALKADLSDGKIPASQLPSYVDDVLEVANYAALPATGETGKIYITQDTNKTYRWGGSAYVEISASLALGETSGTAYAGDKGAAAYAHISNVANPHAVDKADVGLGNCDNTSDAAKPVSTAQATALALKANLASPTFTGTVAGISKAMVGLGNCDNTSDSAKPVSTAQAAADALNLKIASNLSDLNNAASARTNLGLGTAATTAASAYATAAQGTKADDSYTCLLARTSNNTAWTLVNRDTSGSFSAGTITAALKGNTYDVSGAYTSYNYTTTAANALSGALIYRIAQVSSRSQIACKFSCIYYRDSNYAGSFTAEVTGSVNYPSVKLTNSYNSSLHRFASLSITTDGTNYYLSVALNGYNQTPIQASIEGVGFTPCEFVAASDTFVNSYVAPLGVSVYTPAEYINSLPVQTAIAADTTVNLGVSGKPTATSNGAVLQATGVHGVATVDAYRQYLTHAWHMDNTADSVGAVALVEAGNAAGVEISTSAQKFGSGCGNYGIAGVYGYHSAAGVFGGVVTGPQSFAVSAWVYVNGYASYTDGDEMAILAVGGGASSEDATYEYDIIDIFVKRSGTALEMWESDVSGGRISASVAAGWHHIYLACNYSQAFTSPNYVATVQKRVYLDGADVGNTTLSTIASTKQHGIADIINLGGAGAYFPYGNNFKGNVDEVMFWSGSDALHTNAADIAAALYNSGTGRALNTTSHVLIPAVGGAFAAGDYVQVSGTTNYDNAYTCAAVAEGNDYVLVPAAFTAETVSGGMVYYRQPTTAAQIQAAFDSLCLTPGRYSQFIQFYDGYYTLTNNIIVNGIGGLLYVQGNAADTDVNTNKRVVFSGAGNADFRFTNCSNLVFRRLKIVRSSVSIACVSIVVCPLAEVIACTFVGARGVYSQHSNTFVNACQQMWGDYAVSADSGGSLRVNGCRSIAGALPIYGIKVDGVIATRDASQIDGSTADDVSANGGRVFTPTAII